MVLDAPSPSPGPGLAGAGGQLSPGQHGGGGEGGWHGARYDDDDIYSDPWWKQKRVCHRVSGEEDSVP